MNCFSETDSERVLLGIFFAYPGGLATTTDRVSLNLATDRPTDSLPTLHCVLYTVSLRMLRLCNVGFESTHSTIGRWPSASWKLNS
ncbi:hypothetical protein Ae201684_007255 [Aphanomyces euteiches]|uniref:Uncharacterized protein n=1 Tax=Aphanomyces euteiches TaxID=100861 RepID=A0A6G0X8H0_9STRA|nr:hypothetical protein Ae201684_007255 [Aphanomyces euteiches]